MSLVNVAHWLSINTCTKRLPVSFPVGAHAQVVGQVSSGGGHAGGGQSIFSLIDVLSLSLSPFLTLSLKINKGALASLAQRLECRPVVQRDPGSVPAKGVYLGCSLSPALVGRVGGSHSMCPFHIDVSLSLSSSLSFLLYLYRKWKNVLG
uniref:Uncharacterized protein n=1 Tax=Molossus molossus TaxID=27622 RepID=A0A7J8FSG2_MOLMO|nr:hypothetical protein HJG59_008349 [Molossus molossus]